MISQADVAKLLSEQIADPGTQWSLGTFGGIAEFARDPDEPVTLTASDRGVAAVTARGGIAIRLREDMNVSPDESFCQRFFFRSRLCSILMRCSICTTSPSLLEYPRDVIPDGRDKRRRALSRRMARAGIDIVLRHAAGMYRSIALLLGVPRLLKINSTLSSSTSRRACSTAFGGL